VERKTKVIILLRLGYEPGEHLSIVGLNGAGKTTFIKLLCRLYDPTGGVILLDGVDIREYDYADYMSQFAPVFQDFKLFCVSLKENITLQEKDDNDLSELLKLVELDGFAGKLKKGTDTCIYKFFDEESVEPSGGEQQKRAIARALYKQSPIVILDEPTAALDPIAEYGNHEELAAIPNGIYAEMFEAQAQYYR